MFELDVLRSSFLGRKIAAAGAWARLSKLALVGAKTCGVAFDLSKRAEVRLNISVTTAWTYELS